LAEVFRWSSNSSLAETTFVSLGSLDAKYGPVFYFSPDFILFLFFRQDDEARKLFGQYGFYAHEVSPNLTVVSLNTVRPLLCVLLFVLTLSLVLRITFAVIIRSC
jgi:hypothetical protein